VVVSINPAAGQRPGDRRQPREQAIGGYAGPTAGHETGFETDGLAAAMRRARRPPEFAAT